MITLNAEILKKAMPNISQAAVNHYLKALALVCTEFEITTAPRLAAFLAQIGHETGDLVRMEENLNYNAKRLLEVFPAYFNKISADAYANKPKMIASRVYANRMGNGPEDTGDGYAHRGKGMIQATGKELQTQIAAAGGFKVENLTQPYPAAYTAGYYWRLHNLNALADLNSLAGFQAISRVVNLGPKHRNLDTIPHGEKDRNNRYQLARKALGI